MIQFSTNEAKTIVQRIILENNISDIFRLPCVAVIFKDGERFVVIFSPIPGKTYMPANEGDTLVQYSDGTWGVEKGGER